VLSLVRSLALDEGLAVLIALHDLNLAAQYGDRVALLSDEQLWALSTPQEVLTADILSPVYGLPINIFPHPTSGTPLVLADS